jgi:hypothetical protein
MGCSIYHLLHLGGDLIVGKWFVGRHVCVTIGGLSRELGTRLMNDAHDWTSTEEGGSDAGARSCCAVLAPPHVVYVSTARYSARGLIQDASLLVILYCYNPGDESVEE